MYTVELPSKAALVYLSLPATIYWVYDNFKTMLEIRNVPEYKGTVVFTILITLIPTYVPEVIIVYLFPKLYPSWLGPTLILCAFLATVVSMGLGWIYKKFVVDARKPSE